MDKKSETVFAQAEEKFVKAVVFYGDSDKGHLFYEPTKKNKVPKEELLNYFKKGMMTVFHNNIYYTPVSYKETSGYAVITVEGDLAKLTFHSAEKA